MTHPITVRPSSIFKEIQKEVSIERHKHVAQLSLELDHLNKQLEEINEKLSINPHKLESELLAQRATLEEKLTNLLAEQAKLVDTIVAMRQKIVDGLSKNTRNLLTEEISEELVAIAMQQFIEHKDLGLLRVQAENNADKRKKAHERLTINSKIGLAGSEKNKFAAGVLRFIAQREEYTQKLVVARENIRQAELALEQANTALAAALAAKTAVEQKIANLKLVVTQKEKAVIDCEAYFEKNKAELNGQKITEPQRIQKECSGELERIEREYQANIAPHNNTIAAITAKKNRLDALNAQRAPLEARRRAIMHSTDRPYNHPEWSGVLNGLNGMLSEYNPLFFENKKNPFDGQIATQKSHIHNFQTAYSAEQKRLQAIFQDKIHNKLNEIEAKLNGEFSIKSRDAKIGPSGLLTAEVNAAKDTVTTAIKESRPIIATHKSAVDQQQDQQRVLRDANTYRDECEAKYKYNVSMIEKYNAIIRHLEQQIAQLQTVQQKFEQGTEDSRANELPADESIDLVALNKQLQKINEEKNKIARDIDDARANIEVISTKLSDIIEFSAKEKAELEKSKIFTADKLADLNLNFNAIDEEYSNLLISDMLSCGIAMSGFRQDIELSSDARLVACLLQAVRSDWHDYDINNHVNDPVPQDFYSYISMILRQAKKIDADIDLVKKIVLAINKEFATDGVNINLTLLRHDGVEFDTEIENCQAELMLWERQAGHYVLVTGAKYSKPEVYGRLNKLVLSLGASDMQQELCADVLRHNFNADLRQVPISALNDYYNAQSDTLHKVMTFNQLRDSICHGSSQFTTYKSRVVSRVLNAAADLEPELKEELQVTTLLQKVADDYLAALRATINHEIQARDSEELVTQQNGLGRIEHVIQKNEQKIAKLTTEIKDQEQKVHTLEVNLKNKQDSFNLMAATHAAQQQEITIEIQTLRIKSDECTAALGKLEQDINADKQKIDSLRKTQQNLDANRQALERELASIEQERKTAHAEVMSLKESLRMEQAALLAIKDEEERAKNIHQDAEEAKKRLEVFLEFIGKVHNAFRDDRDLFLRRLALRKEILDLQIDSTLATPAKALKLYEVLITQDEIAKNIRETERVKIKKELQKIDGAVLTQLYGVILELVGVPKVKWQRSERKYLVTGFNLSWQEVYSAIKQQIIDNLTNCGLGFNDDGCLVVKKLNYFGRISDLPTEIKNLVDERIQVCRNELNWDEDKTAFGAQGADIIAALAIKQDDVLKAYADYIEVIAGNNLAADDDITLPGVSISLYSKANVFCKKDLVVNTTGRTAPGYTSPQAPSGRDCARGNPEDGRPGKNGLCGLAGHSAGHILIKAEEKIENFASIKCVANGGNGALGQKGGDGERGREGLGTPDAEANDTQGLGRAQTNFALGRIPGVGPSGELIPQEISGDGGSAGLGGLGGDGGFAGDINISDKYDQIIQPANKELTATGSIASNIKAEQLQAKNGDRAPDSAGRGNGGPAGLPGERGLDNLVTKDSFWVGKKSEKGYYDESIFDNYRYALDRGWGHGIFGEQAWIDGYCDKYRSQFRVWGESIKPALRDHDRRRKRSDDERSRGKEGEKDANRKLDESNRKKAVANTNYANNPVYASSMRQTALDAAQTHEWNACAYRCKQHIQVHDQSMLAAEARLASCKNEATKAQASVDNVTKQLNTSQATEHRLDQKLATTKNALNTVNTQIQVADEQQLQTLEQLAKLQSQAIEAKAAVACVSIDIDSKSTLSSRLEQTYSQLKAAANITKNFAAQNISKEQDVRADMGVKLAALQSEQIALRTEQQKLLLEKDAFDKRAKHQLLEKQLRKIDRAEKIQVQAMLKYDDKKPVNDPVYVIDEKVKLPEAPNRKISGLSRLICGASSQPIPLEPVEQIVAVEEALTLDEQYLQTVVEKFKPTQAEILELRKAINLAIANRADHEQQEAYYKQLKAINSLPEIMYVLEHTAINFATSAADDGIMIEVAGRVAQLLKDNDIALLNSYCEELLNAIKAMRSLDNQANSKLIEFMQQQYCKMLVELCKQKFSNPWNLTANVKYLVARIDALHHDYSQNEKIRVIRSLVPLSTIEPSRLLHSLRELKESSVEPYDFYANLYYHMIDLEKLSIDDSISCITLVFSNNVVARKNAMFYLLSAKLESCAKLVPEFAQISNLMLAPGSVLSAEQHLQILAEYGYPNISEGTVASIRARLIADNLAAFTEAVRPQQQNIWLYYLDVISKDDALIDLTEQYWFNFTNYLSQHPQSLDNNYCQALEHHIVTIKHFVAGVQNQQKKIKLLDLVAQLEQIVDAKYIEMINRPFAKQLQSLTELESNFNSVDQEADRFKDFHHLPNQTESENKKIFVKLLLAKASAFAKPSDFDSLSSLIAAVNKHAFTFLQKSKLFSDEKHKLLQAAIANKDISMVDLWLQFKPKLIAALGEPERHEWLKQYLLDSIVMFQNIIIEDVHNSESLNKLSDYLNQLAFYWESKVVDKEMRAALDSLSVTIKFAAYKNNNYNYMPQAWQAFKDRDPIAIRKKALLEVREYTFKKAMKCFADIKVYCGNDVNNGELVSDLTIAAATVDKQVIDRVLDEKQKYLRYLGNDVPSDKDLLLSATIQLKAMLATPLNTYSQSILLRKICLNVLDSTTKIEDGVTANILDILKTPHSLPAISSVHLRLMVQALIAYYQRIIVEKLDKISGTAKIRARLSSAAMLCSTDNNALNLLLFIYFTVAKVARDDKSVNVNDIEQALSRSIGNLIANNDIKTSLGAKLIDEVELLQCNTIKRDVTYEWLALVAVADENNLPVEDLTQICRKIVQLNAAQIAKNNYAAYAQVLDVVLGSYWSMLSERYGAKSHNGQSVLRIGEYVHQLILEMGSATAEETIKENIATITSIIAFLLKPAQENTLLKEFLSARETQRAKQLSALELGCLLNEKEQVFVQYVNKDILAQKDALPHLWEDILRGECFAHISRGCLTKLACYLDKTSKEHRSLVKALGHGALDYVINNRELQNLIYHMQNLFDAKIGDINFARKSCKDALAIVDVAFKNKEKANNSKHSLMLRELQLWLVQTLNFKELLIGVYVSATSKGQQKICVSYINNLAVKMSQGFDLEQINQLLSCATDMQDISQLQEISMNVGLDKLTQKSLTLRLQGLVNDSTYAQQDKDKLLAHIKEFDSYLYNNPIGRRFLDILGGALSSLSDKTISDIESIICLARDLKIYQNDDLVAELHKQQFPFWNTILKRAKWHKHLSDLGFVAKYPKLIDNLIALEKSRGDVLIIALISLLKDQQDLEVNMVILNRIVKKFVSSEWSLSQEVIDVIAKQPFSEWMTLLENYFASKKSSTARTTQMLISEMHADKSGINNAVSGLLDGFADKVQNIEDVYAATYGQLIKDQDKETVKKLILDCVAECRNRGRDFYKSDKPEDQALVNKLLASMSAALHLSLGYPLRNTQILALLCFINGFDTGKGRLANISTGEGKSVITALLAVTRAIFNEKVDILTSSRLLAERDAEESVPLFGLFGIKVSNNCDAKCSANDNIKRDRYTDCQVIYGDIGSFQRDYLLSNYMEKNIRPKVGDNLIVDEVDSMCIDNAETTLYISHRIEDLAHIKQLFVLIWQMVNSHDVYDYTEQHVDKIVEAINEQIKKEIIVMPSTLSQFIQRRLKIWINNAYCAKFMKPGSEYSVPTEGEHKDTVNIMDLYTGVEQINTQWSNGLHQFIQLKHRCSLSEESLKAIYISNMNYLRQYTGRIYGMTGTLGAGTELDLLANTYSLDFFKLPRYKQELYRQEKGKIVSTEDAWLDKITADVEKKLTKTREISAEDKEKAEKESAKCKVALSILKKIRAYMASEQESRLSQKTAIDQDIERLTSKLQDENLTASQRQKLLASKMIQEAFSVKFDTKLRSLADKIKNADSKIAETQEELINYTDIIEGNTQRAILIIAEDQNAVKKIYERLKGSLKDQYKYNLQKHDSAFDKFNTETLHPGDIVVATNIAGRGTDFKTSEVLEENGGLHVLLSYMPPNVRVEVQAFGRTARKGNKGTGKFIVQDWRADKYPLSIEFLRDERDAKEAKRLAEFRLKKQPRVELENDLFIKFAALQEQIKNGLKENPFIHERYVNLQLKSLQNHWAFWLDEMAENIENVYKNGREPVFSAYETFASTMLNLLDTGKFKLVKEPGELLKLGKHYFLLKEYSEAEKCYDEIIATDPEFATFAHYYKSLCMFGNESGHDRKADARGNLKKSTKLFERSMSDLSFASQIIQALAKREEKKGEGTNVDYFTQSNAHESACLNIHVQAIKDVLGFDLMPDSFVSASFTKEDSEKVWYNIREKCKDLIKDYRLSKKATVIDEELYYNCKKVTFPEQLAYCKQEVLAKLSAKVSQNLDSRTLEYNIFDEFILTKPEFLQTLGDHFTSQGVFELILDDKHGGTGLEIWLGRNDIKQEILGLKKPLREKDLAEKFGLNVEQAEILFKTLAEKNIIKRATRYMPTKACEDKLKDLLENNAAPKDFLKSTLGIDLSAAKQMHKARYEELILQAYLCHVKEEDFDIQLPENAAEKRNAHWALFKGLALVKYPSVNFKLTHDPEAKLDEIKDSLKGKIKDLLARDVPDEDERKKMEESIYDTLELAIGKIKSIPKLKLDPRDLQFYFQEGKMPPEVVDYTIRCCDAVFSLKKDAGWWDWGAFVVALIGIVQLAAGIILTAVTCGLGAYVGQVLISEGISDMMFAAQSMANGNFSWAAYGENKWQSLLISVAAAGVGAAISGLPTSSIGCSFADAVVREAVAKELAAKLIQTVVTCGITIAAGALSKEIAKLLFAELKKSLKTEIRNSYTFKSAEAKLKEKIEHLYKTLDRADAERMVNDAMQSMNLEQKIASHFASHAIRIGDKISGQLGKLSGSDKFAGLDKASGTKLGNSTLTALGSIASILSGILKAADILKVMAEISSNTGTLLEEFGRNLDKADKRTKSNQKQRDHNISDQAMQKIAESHFNKVVDNITQQTQVYIERHLLSGGIVQAIELVRAPTINKVVDDLSADFNNLQTHVAWEKKIDDKAHGKAEISKNDETILVAAMKNLKVSNIYTLDEMRKEGIKEQIITEQGPKDLQQVMKDEGKDGSYVIHRNNKYYLIHPDFKQSLANLEAGRNSTATDLRYFSHHAHRPIQVHNSSAPKQGLSSEADAKNKPIELSLKDGHYKPVINGKEIDIPQTDPDLPSNSCAAQAIVYVEAYEAACEKAKTDPLVNPHEAAFKAASNGAAVRSYIHATVNDARNDPEMRDLYNNDFRSKHSDISGGEIILSDEQATFEYAQRLGKGIDSAYDFWKGFDKRDYFPGTVCDSMDWVGGYWGEYKMTDRTFGALQCVSGGLEVLGGYTLAFGSNAAPGGGLVGIPLGSTIAALGFNNLIGCSAIYTGHLGPTPLGYLLNQNISDPTLAALAEVGINLVVGSAGGLYRKAAQNITPYYRATQATKAKTLGELATAESTLVGTSTRQMRNAAEKIIYETKDHPLKFLLNPEGKFYSTKGLTHAELIDNPNLVQMGHIVSNKSGMVERIMLQGAWENQFNAITVERARLGVFVENAAVDIGGIAVDFRTAASWEKYGLIPPGSIKQSRALKPHL